MRRAQTALEYLVTYGWALLILTIVAGVLWYMGVFDPSAIFAPSEGAKGYTFAMLRQRYAGSELKLVIGNTQGQQVNITNVTVNGVSGMLAPTVIAAGQSTTVTVTSVPNCGATGTRYAAIPVSVIYQTPSGVPNKADSGTITGTCS